MRFLILVAAVVVCAGLLNAQTPKGDAQNGRKLFVASGCHICHNREGQGGFGTAPHLAPKPLPFAAFSAYLRHPAGQMPPFTAKAIPDKDVADIYAFLLSIPELTPVKNIPLLNN